ncbi:arf-GAP with Rho-GAP domain, ANK repeat and PH domain-containing protein 1 isoform X3 [Oryzias melastigma]|uniref:arf-GAP with Rho-GAP domain, ANK repeat and PH domain-containing protein 1 isoform X3 n=1 Tax=Oryzias melastigma TaxID=30732 RepID=UPI000CF827B8|nr:arf-GAP with Rho-GAP domain, ANK repeat and PH domain-containing protein 1 isoform X3 [Oryzias melastigma]XP_024132465.1 arf-GAP with Rho-GAP domain, ANK repeat and PH domain-containing protein 1 isoform X3 [Oryzias melastigma]
MCQSESSATVLDWLGVIRLEQYTDLFLSAGLKTIQECQHLTPNQLERMGITLPGHQRRILASLNKTQITQETAPVPPERDQQTWRPQPVPREVKPESDGETRIPVPKMRDKPIPKERQVYKMQENCKEQGEETGLAQKNTALGEGEQEDGNGELDKDQPKPQPRERTKFRSSAPVDSSSPTNLPPVPPRITINFPPQCFTNSLAPSQPAPGPVSPRLDKPPLEQCRSLPGRSTPLFSGNSSEVFPESLSIQSTPARPRTLNIQPPEPSAFLNSDGGDKASPISPTTNNMINAPPLPPKAGVGPKSPPPLPQRLLAQSPTQSPAPSKTGTDEIPRNQPPQIPLRSKTPQIQENCTLPPQADLQPAVPSRRVPQPPSPLIFSSPDHHPLPGSDSDDNTSDEYERPDFLCSVLQENMADEKSRLQVSSDFCSDDEMLDDDDYHSLWQDGQDSMKGSLYLPHNMSMREDISQQSTVIKQGWLSKNPPQGALYYQRRWVRLDSDYLRYFDIEKAVYSKGIISTAFITKVTAVGDLKLEVVTSNRTFIFKAESEDDRNEWVNALEECTRGRRRSSVPSPSLMSDLQGYLELRGLRSKLYTVIVSDKVFLYKNIDDYHIGVGITSIEMNVGSVKETDRRSFDLITPYRIFSFTAESEQLKDQWVDAMRNAIGLALSTSEIAERIWAEPSNSSCADCAAPKPEWAAINLCVVICKRCAGEHRGLGPSISKVRSLKMDKKVWTEELIQVFLLLGNERVNSFWAANVPPSEALTPSSCSEDRRRYICNKYRQGKYRKYHPLYGNQQELNDALCINVQCSDVLETLSLIFCGADVNCSTGMASCPTPLSLATTHSQPLQAEVISLNLNTELPSEINQEMDPAHYQPSPCVSHNGFLFKIASMARAITERKNKEEFCRRWCTLNDGLFSYYDSDKNANPNRSLKISEIVCLAVDLPEKHGYNYTFELYSESERLYLFGTSDPDSHKEWVKSIAKSLIPAAAEPLLRLNFERIGKLKYKDGLNLQTSKVGWFALVGSTLHAYLESSQGEKIHLRKLNELSIQQDNGVLVLVEKGRTLYIEGERKLDFAGWCGAIQEAARSGGDTLSEQQLTETDVPVIVLSCIGFITQYGLKSEGIYRKSGVNSRVAALCERFRRDARSLCLKEGEHQVDDVSNTLKRFFRELEDGLFTSENANMWLTVAASAHENSKISQYKNLLNQLPHVNKATLQALINHLYCVQCFSDLNQMNLHNLAIVFGPTLFQTDGKDYTAGRAIEDLIQHYILIFEVDEQQLKKQLEEIKAILMMHDKLNVKFPPRPEFTPAPSFICTVYLEEKDGTIEQSVQIPGSMTAAELTCEVLDKRNIPFKDKEYWSCWEVCDKEEMERPLHYQERVLAILHSLGTDSHLLIKKHPGMDAMLVYLSAKSDASKHGMMKFREERSILGLGLPSGNFHDRYFILSSSSLRMYKEIRSNRPEREWPTKNLKVYIGIKKKLRAPTCWGLTVVNESKKQEKSERQQWYLCCDTQSEMKEWLAAFLSFQYDGDVWPQDGLQQTRVSRVLPDARHGNVSLIPLRGSENEMRNSVAAFSQDALSLFRDVR